MVGGWEGWELRSVYFNGGFDGFFVPFDLLPLYMGLGLSLRLGTGLRG